MKQIVATVKPFRAQAVLEAIDEFEIDTVLVSEAKGYGRQKDRLPDYRGSEYNSVYLPKIEITVLVHDELADTVVDRIVDVARTGRIGDGKVFVFSPLADFEIDPAAEAPDEPEVSASPAADGLAHQPETSATP